MVGLLLVSSIGIGSVPAASTGDERLATTDVEAAVDDILLQIDLQRSGDAVWTVEYRTRLDDTETTDAFKEQQAAIEDDPESYTEPFDERMTATAAHAADVTGREMTIANTTVTAEIQHLPQEYGVITYRFEWRSFAAVNGDELHAGQAIDGLFMDEETRLIVTWPEEYTVTDVSPTPDEDRENTVIWRGPTEFTTGEPRVTVDTAADSVSVSLLVGILGTLIGTSGLVWWMWTRESVLASPRRADESSAEQAALLSNEERVVTLLDEHDGRLKQQEIVHALSWTEAKTSQVLRRLREDGVVEVFRLGRENVVSLPSDDDT